MLKPSLFLAILLWAVAAVAQPSSGAPLHPKVAIVAYFEVGADTGDRPGELQYWVERDHLDRSISVPGMTHSVRASADGSEIAVVVGPGAIRPAANLMALGMSPQFDLRQTYWLVQGIAGISPLDAAIGSAFWTDYVINGDLVHSIDPREIPKGWPDGFFALNKNTPEEQHADKGSPDDVSSWTGDDAHMDTRGTVIRLNLTLMRWAFALTRNTLLTQTEEMRALGKRFPGTRAATAKPDVETGANLTTEAFWHGALMDQWAHRWVLYMTDGRTRFGTTAENDSGALVALYQLSSAGRADWNRVFLLRTASNYDRQPEGMTAAESLASERHTAYTGYLPALEAAYAVGSKVVTAIKAGNVPR